MTMNNKLRPRAAAIKEGLHNRSPLEGLFMWRSGLSVKQGRLSISRRHPPLSHRKARVAAALTLSALAGCGGGPFADLDAFMAAELAAPDAAVAPVPAFRNGRPFAYDAAELRSPFERPPGMRGGGAGTPHPEAGAGEFLEQFTFDSLALVGTLFQPAARTGAREAERGTRWGLVQDPDGGVHRVAAGNFLGRNRGRITELEEASLTVVELAADGDGNWFERIRTMRMRAGAAAPKPAPELELAQEAEPPR